jgi:hypothetical protein
MSNAIRGRLGLALVLLAVAWPTGARAAEHLAAVATVASIHWAAGHLTVVCTAAAVLLLLRAVPGAHRAVSRLAGPRAARLLAGGGR